jgi:S1-C subfamily serine protease
MTLKNGSPLLGKLDHANDKDIKRAFRHLTRRDHSQKHLPQPHAVVRRGTNTDTRMLQRGSRCRLSAFLFVALFLFAAAGCRGAEPGEDVVQRAVATVEAGLAPSQPIETAGAAGRAAAAGLEAAISSVYERVNPSVVYIITRAGGVLLSSGSGFVYDSAGHVVTNSHVVQHADSFEVVFSEGTRQRATLVGADADSDLAVIVVDALPEGAHPVTLGDFDGVRVGQFVVAIGNPFGEQGSISLGIVSGLGRRIQSLRETPGGTYSLPGVIQTDAPINVGNSGGPLLNLDGEVIGVSSAIRTETGFNSGVGFAIPVQAVQRVVPAIIDDGRFAYPFIGVSTLRDDLDLELQEALGLAQTRGVYVTSVTSGGPADAAGIIAAPTGQGPIGAGPGGDLIVAIDGRDVQDFQDLISYLVFETQVGQTVEVTVLRSGQAVTLPVTLGERP